MAVGTVIVCAIGRLVQGAIGMLVQLADLNNVSSAMMQLFRIPSQMR